jgi:hypothetical protein
MYDIRTISPSAFERIMKSFDVAKDFLATSEEDEGSGSGGSGGGAGSAAAAAASSHWSTVRRTVSAESSTKPSPFQVAWNDLEKSTDGDLDWAVQKARCGNLAALVEIVMPVEEERLTTSVQALMGFIASTERISNTIKGPAFTRIFMDDDPEATSLVSKEDLRDILGHDHHDEKAAAAATSAATAASSELEHSPSPSSPNKQHSPFQKNRLAGKFEGELMMFGLPLKRWLLKQLSVVKLQAYGSLAAMRIMFPAELRVIHTTLAASIALDYMRNKVILLAHQGMISHHTSDDILEVIKLRREKMLRYRLQYNGDLD